MIIGKAEVPHQPEHDLWKVLVLDNGDEEHDDGREEGANDHPGQEKCIGMEAPSHLPNMEDEHDRNDSATKGG